MPSCRASSRNIGLFPSERVYFLHGQQGGCVGNSGTHMKNEQYVGSKYHVVFGGCSYCRRKVMHSLMNGTNHKERTEKGNCR